MVCSFGQDYCNSPDEDLDITNPYGKMTCLILYIYSLELGSPPLYSIINKIIRDSDLKNLTMLGPYIKSLGVVTFYAERKRYQSDQIKSGYFLNKWEPYNFLGIFLVFRGAQIDQKNNKNWIDKYKAKKH